MKFFRGIKLFIKTEYRKWHYRLLHFGEPKVRAVGMFNVCVNNKVHLFYDCDSSIIYPDELKEYVTIVTKHGFQLINPNCQTIEEVKKQFNTLKIQYPSDYFWSFPLVIRLSAKWNDNGIEISPEPIYPFDKEKKRIFLSHFDKKKLYNTWD